MFLTRHLVYIAANRLCFLLARACRADALTQTRLGLGNEVFLSPAGLFFTAATLIAGLEANVRLGDCGLGAHFRTMVGKGRDIDYDSIQEIFVNTSFGDTNVRDFRKYQLKCFVF